MVITNCSITNYEYGTCTKHVLGGSEPRQAEAAASGRSRIILNSQFSIRRIIIPLRYMLHFVLPFGHTLRN